MAYLEKFGLPSGLSCYKTRALISYDKYFTASITDSIYS